MLFLASVSATTLSPSEQTDVSIAIDGDFPIINIISPQGTTYNGNAPILIDFTVSDLTLDTIWYSLNYKKNYTITQPFSLDLQEGNYVLTIYANDSLNRLSYSEVTFLVDNSISSCGDSICTNQESCSICPADCGSCSQSQQPSGGGSGPGAVMPSNGFLIDKETISSSLKQGESKTEQFVVENKEKSNIKILINSTLKSLIKIRDEEITLKPKQNKTILFDIESSKILPPDIYLGKITIKSGTTKKEIFLAINIESKDAPINVITTIPEGYLKTMPGSELISIIDLINNGDEELISTLVEYTLMDWEGNIILEEKETLDIKKSLRITKIFSLLLTMNPGKYILHAKVNHNGQVGGDSATFEIVDSEDLDFISFVTTWQFVILIVALLIIICYIHKKSNKKRKKRKKK